jgi:hypothetical protein
MPINPANSEPLSSPVPGAFIQRSERFDCDVPVNLYFDGRDTVGRIKNLSASGLSFHMDAHIALKPGTPVVATSLELGTLNCVVRWGSHPRFGLEMTEESKKSAMLGRFLRALQQKNQG